MEVQPSATKPKVIMATKLELVTDEIAVASTRRAMQTLRDKNIEGYIVFEGDPTRYEFTPGTDFVYPATIH